MFRSTVSRRRPPCCTISIDCLPWNAATDSDSSLEQQGIIWKGWQNQHTVCRLSPCYSGSFGSVVCSEHQRPIGDVGLKGGNAQFNQTFGRLYVQCHVPPFQRNDILRQQYGKKSPSLERRDFKPMHMCPFPLFFETQESTLRCISLKCNQEHFWVRLKDFPPTDRKILSSISTTYCREP